MLFFLVSLVLLLLSHPLIINTVYKRFAFLVILSLVLFSGISAICHKKGTLIAGSILSVTSIILGGIDTFSLIVAGSANKIVILMHIFVTLVFFIFTSIVVIHEIARSEEVNLEIIYASIAGYLLIGMAGAMLFIFIYIIDPGSFDIDPSQLGNSIFIYFSFVTLSTLGYGDVTPLTPLVRVLAIILTITGQFYLTVLVATLVGKYLSSSKRHLEIKLKKKSASEIKT